MADRPASRLARSALGGLALGLAMAAAVLGVKAALQLNVDCTTLLPEECAFAHDVAGEVARLQALTAFGCLAVGVGLALVLRKREEPKHDPAP